MPNLPIGYSFDLVFRLLVVVLATSVVVMGLVYQAGRFPTGART